MKHSPNSWQYQEEHKNDHKQDKTVHGVKYEWDHIKQEYQPCETTTTLVTPTTVQQVTTTIKTVEVKPAKPQPVKVASQVIHPQPAAASTELAATGVNSFVLVGLAVALIGVGLWMRLRGNHG